jgi:hypothetical protein
MVAHCLGERLRFFEPFDAPGLWAALLRSTALSNRLAAALREGRRAGRAR